MKNLSAVFAAGIVATVISVPFVVDRAQSDGDRGAASFGGEPNAGAQKLKDYRGFGHDPIGDEQAVNDQIVEREQFIENCMAKSGFTYIPVEPDSAFVPSIDGDTELKPAGVSDPNAAKKNQEYSSALSETERERYWRTKHGYPHDREGFTREEVAEMDDDGDGELSYDETHGESCVAVARRSTGQGVYEAVTMIGDDVQRLQNDLDRAVVQSGLTQTLADCVLKETGHQLSVESVVASLGADSALRERSRDCVDEYKAGVEKIRAPLDDELFKKYRGVIEQYGVLR